MQLILNYVVLLGAREVLVQKTLVIRGGRGYTHRGPEGLGFRV